MINKSQPENSLTKNLQFNSALMQMSETELVRLHDKVETLEAEFQQIPLTSGESAEAVAAVQQLLKIWNSELDQILLVKQSTDAYEQLHRWDNEGGRGDPNPSRRVVIRTEGGKRRVAWANVEENS